MYKPFYIFLFTILFCCEAKTQTNLVPNGSFEEYDICPNNQGQVTGYVKNWFDPTYSSSDYFNSCCTNGIAGVPNNFYGSKNPYDGNGIIGFAMYSGISFPNSREYIAVKLSQKLDSNTNYCFNCYISLAGSWKYACNGFGFYLTDDTTGIYTYSFSTISHVPTFTDNTIISYVNNWKKIEVNFLNKQKDAIYLIIGSFYDDAKVSTSIIDSNALDISYYYIDMVELINCDNLSLEIPNVITPNNDEVNDSFKIKNLPNNSQLFIYNRWGNLIYKSNNYQNDWSPNEISAGTYYYLLNTEQEKYKGLIEIFK